MFLHKICLFSTLLTITLGFAPQLNGVRSTQNLVGKNVLNSPVRNTAIHAASLSEGESAPVANTSADDDDDDEWEYEEYEILKESDFYGSEWKVGTVMDGKNKIQETWCRLVVKEGGEFFAVWGDGGEGKWNFDVASQFISITKDTFGGWGGKKLWAGTVEDFYFVEGTVRGWGPISPASVIGQWQMKRLGVDPDEAGVAPWFESEDEETPTEENKIDLSSPEE
eukprot:scaffold10175_cov268-Chaetoceros_neogracile.AAC.10